MNALDWSIVVAMLVFSLAVGLWYARKASVGAEAYFVAGRSLGWFAAGTSMVATTFSSDTPLFVSGMVRQEGIYANWVWWSAAPAALATTFFFAKWWRRSEAVTELEFIAQRYAPGRGVDALRILRAVLDGGFQNAVIMASVTLAASKILVAVMGLSDQPLATLPLLGSVTPAAVVLIVLGVISITYTAISGLYGVIYTDVIQFIIAMIGAVLLAVIVWMDLSQGGVSAVARIEQAAANPAALMAFVPDLSTLDLRTVTFVILISISWIGMAPGSGHFVQRMLAARTERDAMLSMYWYSFAHFVLRSWPWIVVGLASVVYLPALTDHESAYPTMISQFMPPGLKGLMVASLMAAFMSTLTSQMNWGAALLVNDFYRPYLVPNRDERHYVTAGRIAMLVLTLVAIVVSSQLTTILGAYKYLAVMGAGNAFVLVARWYWWRINVWSEISSMLSSLVIGSALFWWLPDTTGEDNFALRLAINLVVTSSIAVVVTMLTSGKAPDTAARSFCRRLGIGGRGWTRVYAMEGAKPDPANWRHLFSAWLASVALIYALLFAVGQMVLSRWTDLAYSAFVAIAAALVVYRLMPALLADLRAARSGVLVQPGDGVAVPGVAPRTG